MRPGPNRDATGKPRTRLAGLQRGLRGGAVLCMLALLAPLPLAAQDQDDDLKRKLIRQTTGETDADIMSQILALMGQTARRLEVEFDCGAQTQKVQDTILEQLDHAIQQAAASTRRNPSKSSKSSSDRRTASKDKPQPSPAQTPGGHPDRATPPEGESRMADAPAGEGTAASNPDRELTERRRGWGHLPMRDRDEVIEGMDEAVMPRFREWIERYYRALQAGPQEEP